MGVPDLIGYLTWPIYIYLFVYLFVHLFIIFIYLYLTFGPPKKTPWVIHDAFFLLLLGGRGGAKQKIWVKKSPLKMEKKPCGFLKGGPKKPSYKWGEVTPISKVTSPQWNPFIWTAI